MLRVPRGGVIDLGEFELPGLQCESAGYATARRTVAKGSAKGGAGSTALVASMTKSGRAMLGARPLPVVATIVVSKGKVKGTLRCPCASRGAEMSRRLAPSSLVAFAVLLASAAGASGAVTQLGPPPWKECGGLFQAGSGGCVASEPMAMDDTSVGNVNISPHVIRAGETLTISAEWLPGWAITGFNFPPGEVVSGCGAGEHSCTVKINGTTGGYERHQLNFCCFNAREQDYYAVTPPDEYTIEGTVMDRVGPRQELQPSAFTEVTATIDGEVYPGTTNKKGQYAIQVEAGSGTVRTAGKQCVKTQLPKCVTQQGRNRRAQSDRRLRGATAGQDQGRRQGRRRDP